MRRIKDYNFRELYNQYLFIYSEALKGLFSEFLTMDASTNGFWGYCYLDHEKGLGFEVLQTASYNSEAKTLKLEKENINQIIRVELEGLAEYEAMVLPAQTPFFVNFAGKLEQLREAFPTTEELETTRKACNLDPCRHPYHPDTVTVKLIKGEEVMEEVLVLVEGTEKLGFYGTLRSEPEIDFGLHQGERLSFYNVRNKLGIMCIAVF